MMLLMYWSCFHSEENLLNIVSEILSTHKLILDSGGLRNSRGYVLSDQLEFNTE